MNSRQAGRRGPIPTPTRLPRRALSAVVALCMICAWLMLSPAPAEAQHLGHWKKDWNVRCTWVDRQVFEATAGALVGLFLDMDAEELIEELAEQNCDDSRIGLAWLAREEFRASSHWLEGLGFHDPIVKLAPDDRKYLAWLDQYYRWFRGNDHHGDVFLRENGVYYPNGDIYISPPMIRVQEAVEAHEQFHGVQNSSAPDAFQYSSNWWYNNTWVWEGTARAENLVWAMKSNQNLAFELRYFDAPLYWIPRPDITGPAYATAPFWLDVGRQLRADDYIGYLPKVFEKINGQGAPQQQPSTGTIKAVDEAIEELLNERGIYRGGLAWAYPEFIRYMLDDLETASDHFFLVRPVLMALPSPFGGGPTHTFSEEYDIAPIAANAHKVIARAPPGRVASLRVEVSSADDEIYKNLHLIVDGRRYDRKPEQPDPNWQRNVFATTISGSDRDAPFFVRIANVGSPAEAMDDRYTMQITLQSDEALAIATGGENIRLGDGVLFSYVNVNRDPHEMARSMQTALIDRYADHAGLSENDPAAVESRRTIAEIAESELGPAPAPSPPGAGRSAVTEGAECLAAITIFDDATRSVAKMLWRGSGPFFGGTHTIEGSFATEIHDAIYATVKSTGQELTMLESPEALSRYMEELQGLSMPGLVDALETAGEQGAAAKVRGVLGGLLGGIGAKPSREGRLPAPNRGQESLGRSYDEFGTGTLEIEPSFGDKIVGRFNFTAVDTGADKSVNVEGQFIAIPRPLTDDNLWNGCELMQVPEEDNGDIELGPAEYPPGFESREEEEESEEDICAPFPNWLVCVCALTPLLYPEICWGSEPADCRFGDPVQTVVDDWHEATNDRGERVERRRMRREWPVIEPPRNGGKPCPPPEEFYQDRPLADEPADCRFGEPIDTVIEDWHEVIDDDGERVERRRIRREWPVIEPPRNGGKDCPDPVIITQERPISEDCVDCVVGGVTNTVVRDWHLFEVGGKRYWRRIVRTEFEILRHPNHCGRPCPEGGARTELRPITESDPAGTPTGNPGTDPPDDGPTPPIAENPLPPIAEGDRLGPNLILDFLEEGPANLRSAPQRVKGSASIAQISVAGKPFKLGMSLSDAAVASCGFNQSVRLGLKMLASGRTIKGALSLDAARRNLTLRLKFDQGTIGVRGAVALTAINPTTIRGDLARGTLDLALDQGNFSCENLMNFSFTLTEVP